MNELMPQITALLGFGQMALWTGFLVFLRVGAAMAMMPAFGEQSVPQRIRLMLALGFTAIVAPAVNDKLNTLDNHLFLPLATEVMAGLVLGIALRLFIFSLQIAGTMAAQSTALSQLFGGTATEPQPAMSHLFVVSGLALAVMAGLHVRVAELLILSYDVLPAGRFIPGPELAEWGLGRVTYAFSLAFSLAAPFIAASVIYNIALGVINRAMPQLMVVFVGAPALTFGGLLLLAVATPLLLAVWMNALDGFFAAPFATPQ
jgi:flagellar biosynthetic protein FliR